MRPEKLNYLLSSISSLKGVGPRLEQIINKLDTYKAPEIFKGHECYHHMPPEIHLQKS